MISIFTKNLLPGLIASALFFGLTWTAFALDELEIRADIEDGTAEVDVSYEDDGDNIDEEYEFEVESYSDLVDQIADELNISRSSVENALEYTADDSFKKGDAREKIEEAEDLMEAADEAIDHAIENELEDKYVDPALSAYTDGKKVLEDADDNYSAEDWENAEYFADEAIEIFEEIFDLLGYEADDFVDKDEDDRQEEAEDAIADARDAHTDARHQIEEAEDDDIETREAQNTLDDVDNLIDEAQDEYDDADYINAKRIARQAEELAESIEDMLEEEEEDADAEEIEEEHDHSEHEHEDEDSEEKLELQLQLITLLQQLILLLSLR